MQSGELAVPDVDTPLAVMINDDYQDSSLA